MRCPWLVGVAEEVTGWRVAQLAQNRERTVANVSLSEVVIWLKPPAYRLKRAMASDN
jgi:hypothetical protein